MKIFAINGGPRKKHNTAQLLQASRDNGFTELVASDLAAIVRKTLRYRKMAHTAEDLTARILVQEYWAVLPVKKSAVKVTATAR